ncbi:hypothetical protein FIBSPDRAFT_958553 [Athelia psychrophila]|uniref:Uncharacterized protein n=1 Tax=Athelia psychrophila TaxID=1759441 RepID=A0A166EFC6_9AGAM|nr:hypothetical protein FIBSPDRAFT_958553 [Fibularhizoctonia sp. CBS 109695]
MNHRPDTVARLQAKLDAGMPKPLAIPDITVPQNLPYLNTFIKEGAHSSTRCSPHSPEARRSLPASNSSASHESFDLMGYAPSSSPRLGPCTRDPAVFPSPLPDRWPPQSRTNSEMQAHFIPFGMRSRIWGSLALAMVMMRPTRQEL